MEKLTFPVEAVLSTTMEREQSGSGHKLSQPVEIGNYCLLGSDRQYKCGTQRLVYLIDPNLEQPNECCDKEHFADFRKFRSSCNHRRESLGWDLNVSYDQRVAKDHSLTEKLDNLLHWIMDSVDKHRLAREVKQAKTQDTPLIEHPASRLSSSSPRSISLDSPAQNSESSHKRTLTSISSDFVCYRGLLTKIMCSPYELQERWVLGVTLYRGTHYLCQYDTIEKKLYDQTQDDRMKRMSAWGYKFEQYMTSDKPDGRPNPQEPVNEREEFCSVIWTRLADHSLLYGAEVDASDAELVSRKPELSRSTCRYVELKTSKRIYSERQREGFVRFKMLKWWAQCYLVGIPRVLVGFRSDSGIVDQVASFSTKQMADMAVKKHLWFPNKMITFLNKFLSFVKQSVTVDNPRLVVLFEFDPSSKYVKCMKLPLRENRYSNLLILPEWYINHVENTTA